MTVAVDYEKLGELIDGYGGIAADDLHALPKIEPRPESEAFKGDTRDLLVAELRRENVRLRKAEESFHMQYRLRCDEQTKQLVVERDRLQEDNRRLRAVLAQLELVLIGLRDGLPVTALSGADGCDDLLGGPRE